MISSVPATTTATETICSLSEVGAGIKYLKLACTDGSYRCRAVPTLLTLTGYWVRLAATQPTTLSYVNMTRASIR